MENSVSNKKIRMEWLDLAKGIGLLLVIFGHVQFRPQQFNVWLCSFHMPLFFFLAGVTYNAKKWSDFSKFIKNKVKSLLIPYLLFSLLTLSWRVVLQIKNALTGSRFDWQYLVKQTIGIAVQIRTTPYGVGVWFVPAIFVAFILLWILMNVHKKSKWGGYICSILCLVSGYLYCTFIDVKLPWGIDAAFVAVFFMYWGCVLRSLIRSVEKKSVWLFAGVVSLLLNIVFCYLNYTVLGRSVGMWSNNYGNFLYFLIAAAFGILFIISVTHLVSCNPIEEIGQNSIYYYGTHIILVEFLYMFVSKIRGVGTNTTVSFIVSIAIVNVVVLALKRCLSLYNNIQMRILNLAFVRRMVG